MTEKTKEQIEYERREIEKEEFAGRVIDACSRKLIDMKNRISEAKRIDLLIKEALKLTNYKYDYLDFEHFDRVFDTYVYIFEYDSAIILKDDDDFKLKLIKLVKENS